MANKIIILFLLSMTFFISSMIVEEDFAMNNPNNEILPLNSDTDSNLNSKTRTATFALG